MKKLFIALFLSLFISGCVDQKDIDFFSKNGVIIGEPQEKRDGDYFVPIEFKTKTLHSAQWVYNVEYEIHEAEMNITALYSAPPNGKESIYKGGIFLKGVNKGIYRVFYLNRDRSRHSVGFVELK